jgi:hypothetical protein
MAAQPPSPLRVLRVSSACCALTQVFATTEPGDAANGQAIPARRRRSAISAIARSRLAQQISR